jgi:hypothetical protein
MNHAKLIMTVASAVLCLGVAGGYFVYMRAQGSSAVTGSPGLAADPASVLAGPYVVFRSSAPGTHYGQLAAVPLDDPAGARAILGMNCERTYATRTAGVCLFAKRGVVQTYGITIQLDAQLRPAGKAELTGVPSRARMSADSSLLATTTFVSGHSYAQASFSTETVIRRNGKSLGNIESWKSTVDGRPLRSVDRNFWGVTFANDDDTFYANAASGSTTWLMRGSLKAESMMSLRTNAECPSLSPDQTKIAYKKRLDNKARGIWRLAVLDLRTGHESLLAESRSVDDQVEWLDNNRLLYALSRHGSETTTSDVWLVSADGTGAAAVFIPEASSPAVVRR